MPKTASQEIKAQIEKRGMKLYEYDSEIPGDRLRKVNEAAEENDTKFSIKEELNEEEKPQYLTKV